MTPRRRLAIAAGALAVGAGLASSLRSPERAPSDSAPASAPRGVTAGADDGALARAPAQAGVETLDERILLDANLTVRVVDARSLKPIPGARVVASIDVKFTSDRSSGLEFVRQGVCSDDGTVVFGGFPRRRPVAVRVEAEHHRSHRIDVHLGGHESAAERIVELTPALPPAESSVRLLLPDGVELSGAGIHYSDETNGRSGSAAIGGFMPLDDDPDAEPEHRIAWQLVFPGYAGPMTTRMFRRGESFTPATPTEDRVVQEVALVDEVGRGVDGVEIRAWPVASYGARSPDTLLEARTDAAGLARLPGRVGSTWDLAVGESLVHVPEVLHEDPVEVGSGLRSIRCARRVAHRLRFGVANAIDAASCRLHWISYEPIPGSAIDTLFRAGGRTPARIDRYRKGLPASVSWERAAPGTFQVDVSLLPGAYVVLASTAGAAGVETTIQVAIPGEATSVPLEATRAVRVLIEGSYDRSDGPLPRGTVVIAHRAGWDERVTLARSLGDTWSAFSATPPLPDEEGPDGTRQGGEHAAVDLMLAMARDAEPAIGGDLGLVARGGEVELHVSSDPGSVTVLFPDLRVAWVPVRRDGSVLRGTVEPSSFRHLDVGIRTASGDPVAWYGLHPSSAAALRRGVVERAYSRACGVDGHLHIGFLPGDRIGLHAVRDAWNVSAGPGATVERLDGASARSFLVHLPSDVPDPRVTVVVMPDRK